jgi:integrase
MVRRKTMKKNQHMKKQVQDYLNYRRSLGFQLKVEESVLLNFANYVDSKKYNGPLTIKLSIEWALTSNSKKPITYARRIEVLRPFAKYCSITIPETEIPTTQIFGKAHRRKSPYIFSIDEILKLLDATKRLIPTDGLKTISFYYLFSLLYTTGLRVSEALMLRMSDINWKENFLQINQAKFKKSRLVPIHSSTAEALSTYCKIRSKYISTLNCERLFILDNGTPITYRKIQYTFSQLRKIVAWDIKPQDTRPRIYDLRHTFVCHRLLKWYDEGIDVFSVVPYLSTYLGHVRVADTYWYITGIPQIMNIAGNRFYSYASSFNTGDTK